MPLFRLGLSLLLLAGCKAWEPRYEPVAPPSSYERGEEAMRRGELGVAITLFRAYLAETADPTYRPRTYYQLARAYYATDQYRKTLQTLDEMDAEFPKERWPQVAALRGDAEYALGNRTSGFLEWEKAWELGTSTDRAALRERMGKALAEMSLPELKELEQLVSVREIHDLVETELREPGLASQRAVARAPYDEPGDRRSAAAVAPYDDDQVGGVPPSDSARGTSRPGGLAPLPPIEPVDTSVALGRTVGPRLGALLPLTGVERASGQQALRGLRMAGADTPSTVMLRDTGSDSRLAARLLGSMAGDMTVLAVIAPFQNGEAAAIVPLAEQLGLPLLLPATYRGPQSRYAIPVTAAPPHPLSALARYAVSTFGASRIGILYPNDASGQTTMERFRADIQSQGALVVGFHPYEPGAPDVPAAVATVEQWDDDEGGLSAVFLAGGTDAVTTLATALRNDWPDLKLLATVRLSDRAQLEEAAENIEGAVLANTSGTPVSPGTRGSGGGIETEVFDAATLGRRALENGATTREEILTQLHSMERYGGVEALFRVHDGKIEALAGVADDS